MTKQEFDKAVEHAQATTSMKGLRLANMNRDGIFTCPTCGSVLWFNEAAFSDVLSVKEFFISGMCQTCQNSITGF